MIEISGLGHRIGGATILADIELKVPARSVTAIVGPNGAGKSTLVNLIARQIPIQTGRIGIDGLDVARTAPERLALKLALVAQHVGVASRLGVRDLVTFGRWPHSHGRLTDADRGAVDEAIRLFALEGLEDRFLDTLSGGQRQRAFVAMAYAQATDWLVLDEPLNNLDMRHARALMKELHDMSRESGRSIVLIVHEVNYAAAWADHVIGMKDGRVILAGPPGEVLTAEGVERLFGMRVRVEEAEGRPLVLHHL